jgi:DNA invertase Pin-like site-specific DNA recombinase
MSKAAMIALYARVSSEQQNKRGTIESQIAVHWRTVEGRSAEQDHPATERSGCLQE